MIAKLQTILFHHDQVRESRGLGSECRPLAGDAILRHSPAYPYTAPPPSNLDEVYNKMNDDSWGSAVLAAVEKNSTPALMDALHLPGADVDAIIENDYYITRQG